MKEIIYIQAGNVSNHIGTHFWNAQESYFTYDDDAEPLVDHNVSFREGLSDQNDPTFCPRVLVFDYKSNFGPLSRYNELYPDSLDTERTTINRTWNGSVAEHRQDVIPKSDYQHSLDTETDDGNGEQNTYTKMRYWSDFNRVYYIPRSIHQVSDLPDWQANRGDWNHGRSIFKRFDLDYTLNEDSLRRLLEESNNCQGFQISFDNSSFGGFTVSLLESIRDDLPKIPMISFPLLSGVDPTKLDVEDILPRKSALQDAACICALDELTLQSVPLSAPASWRFGKWSELLTLDKTNIYQTSAVLSAHIESATLPLRLKGTHEDLSSFCTHLNWTQNTRFSQLSGTFPFRDDADSDIDIAEITYDFSEVVEPLPTMKHSGREFSLRNVSRGLSIEQARRVEAFWISQAGLDEPYLSSTHASSYPLPSSFPNIFQPHSYSDPHSRSVQTTAPGQRPKYTSLISALCTTTTTARALTGYLNLARNCVARRYSGSSAAGLELDEVREMVESLGVLVEAYTGDSEVGGVDDAGADEESD